MDPSSEEEKQRLKEEAKKLRLQGQNPDEAPDGDFMSEAKVGAVSSKRWRKKMEVFLGSIKLQAHSSGFIRNGQRVIISVEWLVRYLN